MSVCGLCFSSCQRFPGSLSEVAAGLPACRSDSDFVVISFWSVSFCVRSGRPVMAELASGCCPVCPEPALSSPPVCQYPQHRQALRLIKRQYTIIQQISRCNRRFGDIELAVSHLRVRINERLLIDSPNAFQVAHVERVL